MRGREEALAELNDGLRRLLERVCIQGGLARTLAPRDRDATLARLQVSGIRFALVVLRESVGKCLTPRQEQIARLAASGLGNRGIAQELGLSEATIANHLKRIYAKLHIGSRVSLVRFIELAIP